MAPMAARFIISSTRPTKVASVKYKPLSQTMKNTKSNLIASLATSQVSRLGLERRVAELALGIVSALRDGQLSIEGAWDELFNVDNYTELRRRRASKSLVEIFEYGMELENVAEIAPQSLGQSYDRIERLARRVITASVRKPNHRQKKIA